MTTPTTYPAPQVPPQPPIPPQPAPPGGAGRVVAILTGALGILIAVAAITGAILSTISSAGTATSSRSLDVAGIESLDIDVSAVTLTVEFGDVDEAVLEITSGLGRGDWDFRRDGTELEVHSPDNWFRGWFGGWFQGPATATLTLPSELEDRLDADLQLSAGALNVSGAFDAIDLDVSAGDLRIDGSASTFSVDVSAGRADVRLDGVDEAVFTLSAGAIDARLSGSAPAQIDIDVSAGSLDLGVPDDVYDVRSSADAGSIDNRLETSSSSSNVITVDVSAGSVSLNPER